MLRKVEAAAVVVSLAVMVVSAAAAAASLCKFTVNATVTLPAVAVASTASRGTDASSATFCRIGVRTTSVKSETAPAMVTAIFTANDAGGGGGGAGGGGGCDG